MRRPSLADLRTRLGGDDRAIALSLGAVALAVYLVLIVGHRTPYDYFGRLAYALWQGRLWLDGAPLSELEPGVDGHLYNVQPPLPAVLAAPLVPFGAHDEIEVFVSAVFGALSIVPLFLALRALTAPRALAVWCASLSAFGTTLLFTSVDGRSWFAAHATAMFFVSVALYLAATRRSALLIGLCLGAATLARTPVALAAPGLLLLARDDPKSYRELPRSFGLLCLGAAPFALIQAGYDVARWGNPFDIYGPQLHQATDPVLARGFLSPSYIPRKLYAIFFETPRFVDGEPLFFLRPRGYGMSMLIATPAFLWIAPALLRLWSDHNWRAIGLAAMLASVPGWLFATVGYEQYGYRYGLDVQPFLIALVAVGAAWRPTGWARPAPLFQAAVVLSILVTAYFLVTIRLFGFAP
ncbi:MAG TPA: hypothetical protein VHG53_01505 [Candidatus Limnocylindria bacterium]|nr:hypothetical protein [Candidatus Limnocylindria bacterium]